MSVHPIKKFERVIREYLEVKAPLYKIAEALEISYVTLWRHYRYIIDEFDVKRGQRSHEPTPESRNRVKLMAIAGITQDDMSKVIGISKPTLEAHYRDELDLALIEANMKVAANMYAMATGPRDQKNTVVAGIWWTKARMGWKDTSRIENTGPNGGPIQVENQVIVVLPDNGRGNPVIDVRPDDDGLESMLPQPEPSPTNDDHGGADATLPLLEHADGDDD